MSLAMDLANDPRPTTSPHDDTGLIASAHPGYLEVVRRLIAAGALIDHVNNLYGTAVMEAVVLGDGGLDYQTVLARCSMQVLGEHSPTEKA